MSAEHDERPRSGVGRWAVVLAASVALIAVAGAAFAIGRLSTLGEETPSTTSAEAGFARDMQVHHQQGVELAMIVRDATDDPDVRLLGYDIATRPAADGSSHEGHDSADGSGEAAHVPGEPMPGLATPEQVAELRELDGVEAERRFLELMIAHHEGAVVMAEAVLERSTYPVVVSLAESIILSQQAEIALMEDMLAERS